MRVFAAVTEGLSVAGIAMAIGVVATLAACWLAPRWGLVDRPDERRKTHGRVVPLGGGVAFFLATVAALAIWWWLTGWEKAESAWKLLNLGPLLGSSLIILFLGLMDDRWGMRGRQKLFGQLVAASILMASGYFFDQVSLFGTTIALGIAALPVVLFWILGAINAVNLLDGADGFAGTVGMILAASLGCLAAVSGRPEAATVAFAFAGAIGGFLIFNFPPAKIFMGDAGSMLIGLVIGALSIQASLKGPGTLLLAAPLAVLAIPVLDSLAAILRRKLTGRSIYSVDHGHLHHCLLERLGNNRKLLVAITGICLITCIGGIASLSWENDWIALVAIVGVVTILVIGNFFGRGELFLLLAALRRVAASLVPPWAKSGKLPATAVQLQGTCRWEMIWEAMLLQLSRLGLVRVTLDVNMPFAGESFHASWRAEDLGSEEGDGHWKVMMPLFVSDVCVGRLEFVGRREVGHDKLLGGQLFSYARMMEDQLVGIVSNGKNGRIPHPVSVPKEAVLVSDENRALPALDEMNRLPRRFPR